MLVLKEVAGFVNIALDEGLLGIDKAKRMFDEGMLSEATQIVTARIGTNAMLPV